jgi:Holliday junction DNA helicase RuvA
VITSISGKLVRVRDDEARVQVGAIEYQVLVPELVRRRIQAKVGQDVTLHTLEFLEGNPTRGRMIPRLVGFMSEAEIEFFELFCTVDGIGVRTALKALVRPVRDVADMIQRQDAKLLATLPGVGGSAAERIIAKLRKKVTKFALMVDPDRESPSPTTTVDLDVIEVARLALISVGHTEAEARSKLEKALATRKRFTSSEEILLEVYRQQ